MPAAANGKLFGAVTSNVIMEALAKQGFEIERKRIEISGSAIKQIGNYHVNVKLYEAQVAEVKVAVKSQLEEEKAAAAPKAEKKAAEEAKAE